MDTCPNDPVPSDVEDLAVEVDFDVRESKEKYPSKYSCIDSTKISIISQSEMDIETSPGHLLENKDTHATDIISSRAASFCSRVSGCFNLRHTDPSRLNAEPISKGQATNNIVPPGQVHGNDQNEHVVSHNPHLQTPPKQRYEYSWALEVLSATISVLALGVIIIISAVMDQRFSDDWPYSITLNATIAILSQVAQMCMIYNIAECISQHKWLWFQRKRKLSDLEYFDTTIRNSFYGALKLLCKIRSLATIGASIVIGSIAFAPMLQQMAHYPEHFFPLKTEMATAMRAQQFTHGGGKVPRRMEASIQASLLQPTKIYDYEATCPGSNCIWDPFPSLAICGTCQALSGKNWTTNCQKTQINDYRCSWNLPHVVSVPIRADFSAPGSAGGFSYILTTNVPLNVSSTYFGIGNPIISFTAIAFERNEETVLYEGPLLRSDLCSLFYCVQTLNVSVTNGNKVSEQILHTWFNETLINADVRGQRGR